MDNNQESGLSFERVVFFTDAVFAIVIVLIASAAVWFGNTVAEFLQFVNDKRLRSGALL